jgi:transposase
MPKPYSQDLRDRVIDAVERGKMSRRAAARRYEISESVAIKGLSGLNGTARESLSGTAATGLPS